MNKILLSVLLNAWIFNLARSIEHSKVLDENDLLTKYVYCGKFPVNLFENTKESPEVQGVTQNLPTPSSQ